MRQPRDPPIKWGTVSGTKRDAFEGWRVGWDGRKGAGVLESGTEKGYIFYIRLEVDFFGTELNHD